MMSKLQDLSEAFDGIDDGATIGLGGWIFNSQPMALVRELIRRNKRNLRIVPAPGSIAPDMLIGAGCVAETGCVFISFEQFGLAPHFRNSASSWRNLCVVVRGPRRRPPDDGGRGPGFSWL